MAFFDLSLAELREYKPERHEPADFDQFWQESLAETAVHPLHATFTPVDYGLQLLETFDVTFNGYGGQPIKAWLLLPRQRVDPLPCVVEFIGYGGGRGLPTDWLRWASAGVAHLVMDTRGQGSAWLHGDTPDLSPHGSSPQMPGFMTRGILDPRTYYYRRLYLDGVRAVAAAKAHPAVDAARIAVTGSSQGGGITLAVAGLEPTVKVAMPDVPFLCHFRRATDLVDTQPYFEITRFCRQHRHRVDTVFATLQYFDGMHFAARGTAVAYFSVGLMDDICPPSTVFAAYNHYRGPKSIEVYPYNNHEGGGSQHAVAKLRFLQQYLKSRTASDED